MSESIATPVSTAVAGVYRTGPEGGQPLIFLHSSQSSAGQWRELIASLNVRCDCIAVDLIGYGRAPALTGATAEFRLADEVTRLQQIVADLKLTRPAIVVGHSYGGAIALKLAVEQPFQIAGLVVYEPVAFHLLPQQHAARDEIAKVADAMAQLSPLEATRGFVDYWNHDGYFAALPEKIQQLMARQAEKVNADFAGLLFEPKQLDDYRQISVPVQLLCGESSRLSAQTVASLLARVIPDVTVNSVNAGHMAPLTHPQLVNPQVIEFINKLL